MQSHTGHQNGRDRDQRHRRAARQLGVQHRAFVATEEALDSIQCDWIDVPGVTGDVGDMPQTTVVGRMESVIHRRGQSQRHVLSAPKPLCRGRIPEQLAHGIRRALSLQCIDALEAAAGTDDCIAWAGNHRGVRVEHPRSRLERPGETGMQTAEALLARIAQVQVGEQPPDTNRQLGQQGTLDPAEPAHQVRQPDSGYTIGQQKVQIFLQQQPIPECGNPGNRRARRGAWVSGQCGFHRYVKGLGYRCKSVFLMTLCWTP